MKNVITNYALVHDVQFSFKQFPRVFLSRWKFLERPTNRMLSWLGAKEKTQINNTKTITLVSDSVSNLVREVMIEFCRHTGKYPTAFVIGRKQQRQLGIENLYSPILVVAPVEFHSNQLGELYGVKLFLNPFIDGIVPLDELP